jgi:hypothetical protein
MFGFFPRGHSGGRARTAIAKKDAPPVVGNGELTNAGIEGARSRQAKTPAPTDFRNPWELTVGKC